MYCYENQNRKEEHHSKFGFFSWKVGFGHEFGTEGAIVPSGSLGLVCNKKSLE
jgi:hypothetical protein